MRCRVQTVSIKQIYYNAESYLDGEIKVRGWVRTTRESKSLSFIALNDGSYFKSIQVVAQRGCTDNYDLVGLLNVGTAVCISGFLVLTPGAKQPFEIKAHSILIEGKSAVDYPLQKKRHTLEYLRTIPHLRPRTNTLSAVFRVRSKAAQIIHRFFEMQDFVYVNTPIITTSDCEGAGEMFCVTTKQQGESFFQKDAYLSVSGQLNLECFAQAYDKVYTFGPAFRAENSNTPRHAAEFWMLEPEMAFFELDDDMQLAEQMIKYVIKELLNSLPDEFDFFNQYIDSLVLNRLQNVLDSSFERITYTDAINLLLDSGQKFDYPVEWGCDLQTEHERFITENIFKKPVFVTDYPAGIKAFYMRQNTDGKTVAAMDLLVPGVGEIIGGSQREERYEVLKNKIIDSGLDIDSYKWYLDLRKYGSTKHSGFGMGFERFIMYVTGMQNIRDVIPFARTVNNALL